MPVPHAHEDPKRRAEDRLDRTSLGPGQLGQGGATTDGRVVVGHLPDKLGRGRAASSHPRQVILHLVQRVRRSVRHHQDGDHLAVVRCTCSTKSSTVSTGVEGRTPWPRLKMWPGREPARVKTSSARRRTSSGGPRRTTGSRLPCTATSAPNMSPPPPMSILQSNPMTSPPASRSRGSRPELPVAK